jgi:hypothetical protein
MPVTEKLCVAVFGPLLAVSFAALRQDALNKSTTAKAKDCDMRSMRGF